MDKPSNNLYSESNIEDVLDIFRNNQKRFLIKEYDDSKIAIGFLAAIAVLGIFVVGYGQGQTFSIVQGTEAFDSKYLHEFTHDIRHVAGFPCH